MKSSNKLKEIIQTIVGSLIMAIGVSQFLLPNQLSTGGFSGIATITYYLINTPVGLMSFLLNIPIFLFALKRLGKGFFLKSIFP